MKVNGFSCSTNSLSTKKSYNSSQLCTKSISSCQQQIAPKMGSQVNFRGFLDKVVVAVAPPKFMIETLLHSIFTNEDKILVKSLLSPSIEKVCADKRFDNFTNKETRLGYMFMEIFNDALRNTVTADDCLFLNRALIASVHIPGIKIYNPDFFKELAKNGIISNNFFDEPKVYLPVLKKMETTDKAGLMKLSDILALETYRLEKILRLKTPLKDLDKNMGIGEILFGPEKIKMFERHLNENKEILEKLYKDPRISSEHSIKQGVRVLSNGGNENIIEILKNGADSPDLLLSAQLLIRNLRNEGLKYPEYHSDLWKSFVRPYNS